MVDNYRLYDECMACFKEEEMKEVLVKIVSTEGCEMKRIGVEEGAFESVWWGVAKKLTILDLTKKENARVRALSLNDRSVWYCWSLFCSPDRTLYVTVLCVCWWNREEQECM